MFAKMCSAHLNTSICLHNILQTILLFLSISPSYSGYSWSRHNRPWMQEDNRNSLTPYFEITTLSPKISTQLGQTVVLPCTVRNIGDKVVSWIRTRDLHILTSGIHTYTSDNRFEVIHDPESDSWSLRIKKTRLSDSGKYECQVNTDPKMNNALLLSVTESHMHDSPMADGGSNSNSGVGQAFATIRGPRELFVRAGSTITFTCVVSRGTTDPSHKGIGFVTQSSRSNLKWTHAGRDVSFQSSRGGISVDTDYRTADITSRLTVAMVRPEDAGNYTCEDINVKPDTVTVVVFEGEHTEAMQRDYANGGRRIYAGTLFMSFLFIQLQFLLQIS